MMSKKSKSLIDEVKNVYDTIADSWYNVRNRPFWFVKKYSEKVMNKKVIEIGCGAGAELSLFAKDNFVVGLDISRRMIHHAKKLFEKKHLQGYFVIGNAINLPIKDNSFDVVLCIATLHHIPNKKNRIETIIELIRISRDEVFLSVWKRQSRFILKLIISFVLSIFGLNEYGDVYVEWNYKGKKLRRFYHLYSRKELEEDLKSAGAKKYFISEDCKGNVIAKVYG